MPKQGTCHNLPTNLISHPPTCLPATYLFIYLPWVLAPSYKLSKKCHGVRFRLHYKLAKINYILACISCQFMIHMHMCHLLARTVQPKLVGDLPIHSLLILTSIILDGCGPPPTKSFPICIGLSLVASFVLPCLALHHVPSKKRMIYKLCCPTMKMSMICLHLQSLL